MKGLCEGCIFNKVDKEDRNPSSPECFKRARFIQDETIKECKTKKTFLEKMQNGCFVRRLDV